MNARGIPEKYDRRYAGKFPAYHIEGLVQASTKVVCSMAMTGIYRENRISEAFSLIDSVGLDRMKAPIVSVTGGGGKTSTIRCLAKEYVKLREPVAVMTTTHMMAEERPWFLLEPSVERMRFILERYGQVWVGTPARGGKMKSVPEEFLEEIWNLQIPVLIEADGAKRLPVKAPADYEPVVPPGTTHLLSVYGLDALGRRIRDICFRPERVAEILKKDMEELITPEDIAELAASGKGGRKGCPKEADYMVVLNKADDAADRITALEICRRLEKKGITRILVTSHKEGRRNYDENTDKRSRGLSYRDRFEAVQGGTSDPDD